MIVLCVVLILSLLTVISWRFFNQKTASELLLARLKRSIGLSRNLAISHNYPVYLKPFHKDWSQGFVIENQEGKQLRRILSNQSSGKLILRIYPKGSGVEFLPNGFTNQSNGTFKYYLNRSSTPQWLLVINKFGRVNLNVQDQ